MVGEISDRIHLVGRNVARRNARLFERQRDDRITGHLVRMNVALCPVGEPTVVGELRLVSGIVTCQRFV